METLNESQFKAVTFQGKHALVLAGAGTGKTKTIIARAAYLIKNGTDPDRIQILTFTKRAAAEIVNRVKTSLNDLDAKGLKGSTFHSWCNYLISRYPKLFGSDKFTVIDSDDQLSIMKMVCGKNKFEYERIRLRPQSFLDIYSFARNTKRNLTSVIKMKFFKGISEEEIQEKITHLKADLEVILRGYEAKKRERKYLDYDDMLQLVAAKLKNDHIARELICNLYDHILVDEMQDTNPLQWDLLDPFQSSSHLFCVGDDAQSIYAFRGADFKNIHDFTKNVSDSEVIRLEDNYRSTQEILDISNWLLDKSPLNYNKNLKAVRGHGKRPEIFNDQSQWEEARYIAECINTNYTENGKLFEDHLVLTRSLYASRAVEAVFIEKKIPYVTYGGRGFMESAHIKDLFSALRVVNNYTDEIAWIRFLTLWPGIGEVSATRFIQQINQLERFEDCLHLFQTSPPDNYPDIRTVLESILRSGNDVSQAVKRTYSLLEPILSDRYPEDWEQKRKQDFPVLELLASHFGSILEFITECLLDGTGQINNSPTLQRSELRRSEKKDRVIISTIHSAKGLEADICFVLNVSPGAYPSALSLGEIDEVEEERRVLYVALTRAKNELILTRNLSSINAQPVRGTGSKLIESYFLHDLPDNLVIQKIAEGSPHRTPEDIESENSDIDFGMDFS